MVRRHFLLLAPAGSIVVAQELAVEPFTWLRGQRVQGRLVVPRAYKSETYNYREGVVETLRYKSGAYIVLQFGGMYRLPLFQEPEFTLTSEENFEIKTRRVGLVAGTSLHWREDNFKPAKPSGPSDTIWNIWPPNIGYARVPSAEKEVFDKALDSYVRAPSGPTTRNEK